MTRNPFDLPPWLFWTGRALSVIFTGFGIVAYFVLLLGTLDKWWMTTMLLAVGLVVLPWWILVERAHERSFKRTMASLEELRDREPCPSCGGSGRVDNSWPSVEAEGGN